MINKINQHIFVSKKPLLFLRISGRSVFQANNAVASLNLHFSKKKLAHYVLVKMVRLRYMQYAQMGYYGIHVCDCVVLLDATQCFKNAKTVVYDYILRV